MHALDFGDKNYSFRMQSITLVDDDGDDTMESKILTPRKRRQEPDGWLTSPPKTRKSRVKDDPLIVSLVDKKPAGVDQKRDFPTI